MLHLIIPSWSRYCVNTVTFSDKKQKWYSLPEGSKITKEENASDSLCDRNWFLQKMKRST